MSCSGKPTPAGEGLGAGVGSGISGWASPPMSSTPGCGSVTGESASETSRRWGDGVLLTSVQIASFVPGEDVDLGESAGVPDPPTAGSATLPSSDPADEVSFARLHHTTIAEHISVQRAVERSRPAVGRCEKLRVGRERPAVSPMKMSLKDREKARRVIPDGWPYEDPRCCVCGRNLDETIPIIEAQLQGRLLQACARPCLDRRSVAVGLSRNDSWRAGARAAERLKNLYGELSGAASRDEISWREVLPMLHKLLDEQCGLLWVTRTSHDDLGRSAAATVGTRSSGADRSPPETEIE
jgi:hypothetical protein